MRTYKYRPLVRNSIRVLILHPSFDPHAPISCTICHIQHHHSHAQFSYQALSYTWGDATVQKRIYVSRSQEELLVGSNCHDALRDLRLESKHRLLWIDAICINQEDLEERADQVKIMDQIYSNAACVVVYLGVSTPGSQMLIQELAEEERRFSNSDAIYGYLGTITDEIARELSCLLERPWFKRVWVLQEVRQKRNVILMCGLQRIPVKTLSMCMVWHRYLPDISKSDPYVLELVLENGGGRQYCSVPGNLWKLLGSSRENLASDPRDKVFALRSLISDGREAMDHLISYVKTVEEVFVETAMFLLPELGMRILTGTRHPHSREMPSWVPGWSQCLPVDSHFFSYGGESSEEEKDFLKKKEFSTQVVAYKESTLVALHAKGVRYAKVTLMSQPFRFASAEDANSHMQVTYGLLPELKQLVTPEFLDSVEGSCELGQDILAVLNELGGVHLFHFLNRDEPPSLTEGEEDDEICLPCRDAGLQHAFYHSLQHCRIALLDNNKLSLVSDATCVGDVVYVLNGGHSPCVLRQIPDGDWRLITGDSTVSDQEFVGWEGFDWCKRYVELHNEDLEMLKLL